MIKVPVERIRGALLAELGLLGVDLGKAEFNVWRLGNSINNYGWDYLDEESHDWGWCQVTSEGKLEVHMDERSSSWTPPAKKEMDAKLIERGFMPPRNVVDEL